MILIAASLPVSLAAQETAITYQGQLQDGGQPFTGSADLEFRLFDQEFDGNQVGTTQTRPGWPIEDGLFQVELDFGTGAFTESARYLEVRVEGNTLSPRQAIRPTPTAQVALSDQDTLSELSCAEGQIPKQSNGSWVCAEDSDALASGIRAYSVTGAAFEVPDLEDDLMDKSIFGGYAYADSNPDSIFLADLYTPLHLPDGATIESLRCFFYDGNPTYDLADSSVALRVRNHTSTAVNTAASLSMTSSGESSVVQEASDNSIASSLDVVDNVNRTYWLDATWSIVQEAVGSAALRFYGCTVEYSVG
ncbi:MAG: hypothetical protein U5L08_15685 [Xanthomonadales bacterium]|nr:hypothetical protein [Xanthomonadales bacterium]